MGVTLEHYSQISDSSMTLQGEMRRSTRPAPDNHSQATSRFLDNIKLNNLKSNSIKSNSIKTSSRFKRQQHQAQHHPAHKTYKAFLQ